MTLDDDITSLTTLVQRMVDESGNPQDFDVRAWLDHWLVSIIPALGHRRPLDVLKEPGGLDLLRGLLLQAQSGTFS
ncbi:antitoxin Xre/MbcA/ParS toxin-binding domain-containing protein [Pulveribacter sp.]|uniref:antitoxin Xre/MbcA/ParS toxin-binding domain-containing protein n=1 Tax=Pulveribacter sp. TaxID=2678893 RepID=UPI0028A211B9|nr:antitoxin Xre/MbcA/ParS toxin-binding domain-containing protein [Pulveribacter sp.]